MRIMSVRTLSAAAALLLAAAAPTAAQDSPADERWLRQMLAEDPACDPPAVEALARAARSGIEREVGRREDSIRPPAASAELSCLGDLMNIGQLDISFPTQRLTTTLPGFLQGLIGQILGAGGGGAFGGLNIEALAQGAADPTRFLSASLCGFAQDRWGQGTLPVFNLFGAMGPQGSLPALPAAGQTLGALQELLNPAQLLRQAPASGSSGGGAAAAILGLGGSQ